MSSVEMDEAEPGVEPVKEPLSASKDKKEKITGDLQKDVYAAAAECIDAVLKRRASVKSAIFNSPFEVL